MSLTMIAILVRLPKPYLKKLSQLVAENRVPNVSEAVRIAVRDYLQYEFPNRKWILEAVGS